LQFVNGNVAFLARCHIANADGGADNWTDDDNGMRIPGGDDARFDRKVKRLLEHSVCSALNWLPATLEACSPG
jgi:hypothetical protein